MKRSGWVRAVAVWVWVGLALGARIALVAALFARPTADGALSVVGALDPSGPAFLVLGALIASRRRRNVIGLLMMVVGTATTLPWFQLQALLPADSATTEALLLTEALFGTFAYVLTVFPVLFLLLLFPTGRPPGPRWRPLLLYGFLLILTIVAIVALTPNLTVGDAVVRNPLSPFEGASAARMQAFADGPDAPYVVLLFLFALGSAAAPFVRYRRAGALERAQIRWLLYAGALFLGAFFAITLVGFERAGYLVGGIWNLGLLAIPVAVAIAILRYRLFDIDVIIRRTLQYGLLTGLLTGLYFGCVLLLRTLLGPLAAGADSPPVVMVTTLALAALFNPLRVRVQRFIDGRFYRRRVDGERAVARFAALARDEVDLDELQAALFGTVERTLQPERMGLWLRPQPLDETPSGRRR